MEPRRFATPPGQGDILLWPPPAQIRKNLQPPPTSQTEPQLLAHPLSHWRQQTRLNALDRAYAYTTALGVQLDRPNPAYPLIVSGHQAQFYHPGILIKYLLADQMARPAGGTVLNLIVDSDLPKSTELLLPCQTQYGWEQRAIDLPELDTRRPMESQKTRWPVDLQRIAQKLDQLDADIPPQALLHGLLKSRRQTSTTLHTPAQWFAATNQDIAHQAYGINWLELPISQLSQTPGFLAYIADMALHADRVINTYNGTLAAYRIARNIRNTIRPLPDLTVTDDSHLELPFWIIDDDGTRLPLYVVHDTDTITFCDDHRSRFTLARATLTHTDEALQALQDAGAEHRLAFRPRALTLSLFTRLFLGDTFLHGIGGGIYDQITDLFIQNYYGIQPPPYAVASATLRLNLARDTDSHALMADLARLDRRLRDWTFNPDSLQGPETPTDPASRSRLVADKQQLITENRALRQSDKARRKTSRPRRRRIYQQIHNINRQLRRGTEPLRDELLRQRADKQRQLTQLSILRHREYFIGLFSKKELALLSEKLHSLWHESS